MPPVSPLNYEPRRDGASRWVWLALPFFAFLHLAWALEVDRYVWRYLHAHGFTGTVNPFGMNLLPYLPGCAVMDSSWRWHAGSGYVYLFGAVLMFAAALGVGGLTAHSIVHRLRGNGWGRHRWRLYLVLLLWLGWFTVPPTLSIYSQWYGWRVGLSPISPEQRTPATWRLIIERGDAVPSRDGH